MSAKKKVAIIGAGVGGLATANLLAHAGHSVSVYEKNSGPGGRMGTLVTDGFTFDTGPSWYLMKDVFQQYFGIFGKKPSDFYEVVKLNPAYKVFFETINPLEITDDFEKNIELFNSIEPGAGQNLREYLHRGENNYKKALKYFLYNNFNNVRDLASIEMVGSLPSLLPVITTSLHSYVSKRFKTIELQQILEYPSVFLGASPFKTPALYQLMSYLDFSEGVFYPKTGGMFSVVQGLCTLGAELGVTYNYNAEVKKIITENSIAKGLVVNGETIGADVVISNGDLYHTEMNLLEEKDRSYSEPFWKKRQAGPSALLLFLGVKGDLPELEHHNLFFVRDWEKNFNDIYNRRVWPESASMYVSRTTATDPTTAPKGFENVFVLVPLPAGVIHNKETVAAYTDKYLEQLERMSGIADLRKRIVVQEVRGPNYFSESFYAWKNTALGMSHTLTQSAFFRPSVKSKKVDNLYYVGGGVQPGIGVPMCIIGAQLVYKQLIGDTSPFPVVAKKGAN